MTEPEADDRLDADVRQAYRAPLPGDEARLRRVLERAAAERRRAAGPAPAWFLLPSLRLSPLAAAAAGLALVLAGTLAGAWWSARRALPPVAGSAPEAARVDAATVTFVLRAPGATRVSVAGDFNGWDAEATPLARAGSGDVWTVRVEVPRGVHYYSFVLDGAEWRPDPSAPLSSATSFGVRNSVLVVGDEGAS